MAWVRPFHGASFESGGAGVVAKPFDLVLERAGAKGVQCMKQSWSWCCTADMHSFFSAGQSEEMP